MSWGHSQGNSSILSQPFNPDTKRQWFDCGPHVSADAAALGFYNWDCSIVLTYGFHRFSPCIFSRPTAAFSYVQPVGAKQVAIASNNIEAGSAVAHSQAPSVAAVTVSKLILKTQFIVRLSINIEFRYHDSRIHPISPTCNRKLLLHVEDKLSDSCPLNCSRVSRFPPAAVTSIMPLPVRVAVPLLIMETQSAIHRSPIMRRHQLPTNHP